MAPRDSWRTSFSCSACAKSAAALNLASRATDRSVCAASTEPPSISRFCIFPSSVPASMRVP
ncbi:Uncharacterised protein [Bordetella pertussis]|nr:Uncharacterised protein [Bordetella pertussis]CFP64038.1 Uncharacterised protein [Bordetella pertussis]